MLPSHRFALSVLCLAGSFAVCAQTPPPSAVPINAAQQNAIIAKLGQQLKLHYVFPDVALTTSKALASKAAHGDYREFKTTTTFAGALTKDLQIIDKDRHFRVTFAPGFSPPAPQSDPAARSRVMAQERTELASMSYGISRVQLLPGNVSYIDLRGFGPAEIVGSAFDSAMTLVAGTKALVLDLRQNGGGEPDSVAYLLSHFFAEGDARHLNDIYNRVGDSTHQYWTTPSAMPRFAGPIYVLTSHDTFSGGEECAYDLQTQKRAILVGETTGGGANPGDAFSLGHDFIAFLPVGRAINPITKTNWERVGVKPDVPAPASSAMKVAYVTILNDLMKKSKDADEQAGLKDILARVQAGTFQLPAYYPRH